MRGGDQPAHIDPGAGPKVHPLRVGEDDLAIGADAPKDLARVAAEHTVERHAAGTGLVEMHLGVAADVKALPVDRCAVGALVNDELGPVLADVGLARTDLAARGQGVGRGCRLGQGAQTPGAAEHHRQHGTEPHS